MTKIAKLRFESKNGTFMLSKVTDIETGLVIPIKSIKIEADIKNYREGILATIVVPIEEMELDGVVTKIKTEEE